LSGFFEILFEDRKNDYLHGNIILRIFSIGTHKQKLCPKQCKIGEKGGERVENKNSKI